MGNPRGGSGRFVGLSWRTGTGRGTVGRSGIVCWTLLEVLDMSRDPQGGLGRVGGLWRRSGTVSWTLGEVRDGSGDLQGSLGWFVGLFRRTRMDWGTHGKVWDGSFDH